MKVPPQSFLQRAIEQFKQGENTSLEELGDTMIELCLRGGNKRLLESSDIHNLSVAGKNGE